MTRQSLAGQSSSATSTRISDQFVTPVAKGERIKRRADMDRGLAGKVAVITGGSVGIGLAIAEGFAAEGTDLVLAARDQDRLRAESERVASTFNIHAVPVEADMGTVAGCNALVEAAHQAFGGADILIDNAGTGSNEAIMEAPDPAWQSYWDLHVMTAVRLARGLVPGMRSRGGGVILHNASICAVQPLWSGTSRSRT